MLLCLDIGNTNVTIGLYSAEKLKESWRLSSVHEREADEFALQILGLMQLAKVNREDIHGAIIASVVPPLTGKLASFCKRYLNIEPLIVDTNIKTGVKNLYEEPKGVGADRIVNAAAAFRLYGGPACIVDFGTATTFDALSVDGDYLGGAIAPGIGIAADALFHRTSKLPRVELVAPPTAIGKNTVHAMQSGLLLGYISLVEGMVARFMKELGPNMRVIATGGLAEVIAKETRVIQVVAPWLTLDGLRMIYEMNFPENG